MRFNKHSVLKTTIHCRREEGMFELQMFFHRIEGILSVFPPITFSSFSVPSCHAVEFRYTAIEQKFTVLHFETKYLFLKPINNT